MRLVFPCALLAAVCAAQHSNYIVIVDSEPHQAKDQWQTSQDYHQPYNHGVIDDQYTTEAD
jgi:hypothetical protein